MKIVCLVPLDEEHKKRVREILPDDEILYTSKEDVKEEDVRHADAIFGNVAPAFLKSAERLKLLQLSTAGTDGYTTDDVLPEGTVLTNVTGAFGLAISEHMLAVTLMLMKKLHLYHEEQLRHAWTDRGPVTSIWNSKTLVVGLGDIGSEYAKRMHALGSTVTGIRRTKQEKPEYLSALRQMDALDEELPKADIVASVLPGTKETYHVFNEERFSRMKEGAIFINVGRGTAVDSMALYHALKSGHLGGASVDVTEPEPLPPDHPLWTAPNIVITPHISGYFHLRETYERILRIGFGNIRRLKENEMLVNVIDLSTGYRKI